MRISLNATSIISIDEIPEYNGKSYIVINDNIPYFTEEEKETTEEFEYYSTIINGRRGVAFANICREIIDDKLESRADISDIKPPGFEYQNRYENIPGKYLYNRSHLIAVQLGGNDVEKENIITGTKSLNVEMIKWENKVKNYIEKHNNYHVLYRVTPIYKENEIVARGVEIESYAVEEKENAKEVCFNIFIYNVQPGIKINYRNR